MADPRLIAAVLGALPLLALLLYPFARSVAANRDAAWGAVIGLLAFLGPGHALAAALVDHPFLAIAAGDGAAVAVLLAGPGMGVLFAVWLFRRPLRTGMAWSGTIAWAAVAYLAVHSFADGLVVGDAFRLPATQIPLDVITISATVLHRGAEGAILVVAAVLASWQVKKALGLLTVGLLTLPGAALAYQLAALAPAGAGFLAGVVVRSFVFGVESGLGLVFILFALVPEALRSQRDRWIGWAAAAFLGILLLHGLVE